MADDRTRWAAVFFAFSAVVSVAGLGLVGPSGGFGDSLQNDGEWKGVVTSDLEWRDDVVIEAPKPDDQCGEGIVLLGGDAPQIEEVGPLGQPVHAIASLEGGKAK